ncbi:hypothetical protein G6F24_018008 [Rhizopus arrhizus]|nr:hypothetical protein G6F24_018008 [Rhizopus arrhizus]
MVVSALVGPWAGLAIDRHGGRIVLVGTSLMFALGLAMLGSAQSLWAMVAAWLILGLAMGAGLYEAAFSSLVRLQHRWLAAIGLDGNTVRLARSMPWLGGTAFTDLRAAQ